MSWIRPRSKLIGKAPAWRSGVWIVASLFVRPRGGRGAINRVWRAPSPPHDSDMHADVAYLYEESYPWHKQT